MNEWEKRVFEELILKGYNKEWAEHCAKFAGSLYDKKFEEVREVMDVISFQIGLYVQEESFSGLFQVILETIKYLLMRKLEIV